MPARPRFNSSKSIQKKPLHNTKTNALKTAITKARFGKASKPKDQLEPSAERSKTSEKKRDYWDKRNKMSKKRAENKFSKKANEKVPENDSDEEFETVAVSESESESIDQSDRLELTDDDSDGPLEQENDQVRKEVDDRYDDESDEMESDDEKRVIDASLKAANRKGKKSGGFQSMGKFLSQKIIF